ncbi:hypothetical protein AB7M49_006613 [Bradyrhizobium elkanii]
MRRPTIFRPENLEDEIRRLWERNLKIQAQARKLLAEPVPDLFLGRQHYEIISVPTNDE